MRSMLMLLLVSLSVLVSPAGAAEFGTQEEAVAMVKRVQAKFKVDGAEATFKAVSDKSVAEFHDRDLYPFIYDMSGVNVAHGARPALIGKNLITLKDQDGKFLVRDMRDIAKTQGQRLVRLQMAEPAEQQDRGQDQLCRAMGDYWVGVGVYR